MAENDAKVPLRSAGSIPSFRALNAPVAQLDRAPDYESGGQEFESLRARHLSSKFRWFKRVRHFPMVKVLAAALLVYVAGFQNHGGTP